MKTFEARETSLPDVDGFMDYAKLSLVMLASVPAAGLSFEEMACRLDLRKKLKDMKAGESMEVSDQDTNALVQCARVMRWRVMSEEIVAFGDYIEFIATGKEPAHPYIAPIREEKKPEEIAPGVEVHLAPEPDAAA